jgi:succinoglycan biosynthesis protein ExoV
MLNIPNDLGLGDPAILLRTIIKPQEKSSPQVVSFIPHWESLHRGKWAEICRLTGINLIDPRQPVDAILPGFSRSKLVITESMHGAIIADALRIPWIPLLPLNNKHRGKWLDWADSMQIKLRPHRLFPSTLQEARLSVLRKAITGSPVAGLLQKALAYTAARRLERLTRVSPQLSADRVIDRATDAMLGKIELLKKDFS